MMLRQLDNHIQKKKRNWTPTSHYTWRLTQKGIENLNIRVKAIQLLGENIGVNLHDLGPGNGF